MSLKEWLPHTAPLPSAGLLTPGVQRRLTRGGAALQPVSQPWVVGSGSGSSPRPQGTPFNQEGAWLSFPIPGALQGVTICEQSTLPRSSFSCVFLSAHAAQGGLAAGGAEGMGWAEADLDLGEGSREVTVRARSWLRSGSSKRK